MRPYPGRGYVRQIGYHNSTSNMPLTCNISTTMWRSRKIFNFFFGGEVAEFGGRQQPAGIDGLLFQEQTYMS